MPRPCAGFLCLLAATATRGETLYQFGNPNPEEQAYVEMINRSRANPTAEGVRLAAVTNPAVVNAYNYFRVDLALMQQEYAAIPAAAPVAPNGALTVAARGHSQWMLANATQSHYETSPANNPGERMTAAGYDWWTYGENVYSYSSSVEYGHDGFEVDWGGGTGGMQDPRGHRNTIHNAGLVEVGIGVVRGTNGAVGPQVVTQDFGAPWASRNFGTGVAYYDLNGNDFYDPGEGIAGLEVRVSGSNFYCETAIGGGWVVPVPAAAATRTVTFSGLGANAAKSLVVPDSTNAKADLKLTYAPPAIAVAVPATAGGTQDFTFAAVPGATAYQFSGSRLATAAAEPCESLAGVTLAVTGFYNVLSTSIKSEGAASFHLADPGQISQQFVELKSLYRGNSAPKLRFQSRLGYTTSSEKHKVQARLTGAANWVDVDSQTGGEAPGEFALRTVDLAAFAGKEFRLRFLLDFPGGSTYAATDDDFGWFIDAISFEDVSEPTQLASATLTGTSGSFPVESGRYSISIAPMISGNLFPAGSREIEIAGAAVPVFATWAATAEADANLPAGTISANPGGDADADGSSNLVEYAFGTSPAAAGDAAPPVIVADNADLVLRYTVRGDRPDAVAVAVISSDLAGWKAADETGAPAGFTDLQVSEAGNLKTREARVPRAAGQYFLRVRVTLP